MAADKQAGRPVGARRARQTAVASANGKVDRLPLTGYATLGLLSTTEGSTAVELQERAHQQIRHFYWAPALSHIRRELNRLDDLGYVDAEVVHRGRVQRTLRYTLTAKGADALAEWAERPEAEPLVVKNAVILRMWLGRRANDSPAVLQSLEDHIESIAAELDDLREQMEGLDRRFKDRLLALEAYDPDEAGDLRILTGRTAWHRAVMRYCRRNYENELANSRELFKELKRLSTADAQSITGHGSAPDRTELAEADAVPPSTSTST